MGSVQGYSVSAAGYKNSSKTVVFIDPASDMYDFKSYTELSPLEIHQNKIKAHAGDSQIGIGVNRWDSIGSKVRSSSRRRIKKDLPHHRINLNSSWGSFLVSDTINTSTHTFRNYSNIVSAFDNYYYGYDNDSIVAPLRSIVDKCMVSGQRNKLFYFSKYVVNNCLIDYFKSLNNDLENDTSMGYSVRNWVDYVYYVRDVMRLSRYSYAVDFDNVFDLVMNNTSLNEIIKIFNVHLFDDGDIFKRVLYKYLTYRSNSSSNFYDPFNFSLVDGMVNVSRAIDWVSGTEYGADVLENLLVKHYTMNSSIRWICSDKIGAEYKCSLKAHIISVGDQNNFVDSVNYYDRVVTYSLDDFYDGLPVEYKLGVLL